MWACIRVRNGHGVLICWRREHYRMYELYSGRRCVCGMSFVLSVKDDKPYRNSVKEGRAKEATLDHMCQCRYHCTAHPIRIRKKAYQISRASGPRGHIISLPSRCQRSHTCSQQHRKGSGTARTAVQGRSAGKRHHGRARDCKVLASSMRRGQEVAVSVGHRVRDSIHREER